MAAKIKCELCGKVYGDVTSYMGCKNKCENEFNEVVTKFLKTKSNPYKNYLDPIGLVHLNKFPTGPSDNAMLYTATAYILDCLNEINYFFFFYFSTAISNCEELPGLYQKYPGLDKLNSHDNQIGVLSALKVIKDNTDDIEIKKVCEKMIKDVYGYGETFGYNYNNVEPDKFDIKAQRQGSHIAFIKLCAGKMPSPYFLAWLIGSMIFQMIRYFRKDKKETQEIILVKIMLLALRKNPIFSVINIIFNRFIKMKDVARVYYKDHPIIAEWKKLKV